jgi:hypothetical protein
MKPSKTSINSAVLGCLFVLVFARTAYAYIDLGSGSYFFQYILAALLGLAFTIKLYWRRIKDFVARLFFHKTTNV